MNRTLELPETIYLELIQASKASGNTPAGWIQERLPKNGTIGNGSGVTDPDLARQYGDDGRDELEDKGFLEYCRTEGDPNITLQEVREALAVIPGSMTAACSAERDED